MKVRLLRQGQSEIELESRIFESLFLRRTLKAPLSDFCIVNAAADVLRCV